MFCFCVSSVSDFLARGVTRGLCFDVPRASFVSDDWFLPLPKYSGQMGCISVDASLLLRTVLSTHSTRRVSLASLHTSPRAGETERPYIALQCYSSLGLSWLSVRSKRFTLTEIHGPLRQAGQACKVGYNKRRPSAWVDHSRVLACTSRTGNRLPSRWSVARL